MFLHKLDGLVKIIELAVGQNMNAGLVQFVLAKCAVVLQAVGVWSSTHNQLSFLAQLMRKCSVTKRVVKHNHVGPINMRAPLVHLGHKAVANIALLHGINAIFHLVSFFDNLPRNVGDERGVRDEKKFLWLHA